MTHATRSPVSQRRLSRISSLIDIYATTQRPPHLWHKGPDAWGILRHQGMLVYASRAGTVAWDTGRGNLRVVTSAQFVKDGQTYAVGVTREVIMAAGALQSPQLLELPGIGDNLQDHGLVSFNYEVADGMPSGDPAVAAAAAAAMAAYQKDGSGPLGIAALLLQKVDASLADPTLPQMYEKQYTVLKDMFNDPNEPTVQCIMASFQLTPGLGPKPSDVFSLGHPGFFISIVSLLSYPQR
ncbi:hypothetical protein BDW66DRAFT_153579 [Aspergillus desertorum]